MSTAPTGEYEFNESQNQLIGNLARKMGLVGFVLMLFGGLQLFNGIMTFGGGREVRTRCFRPLKKRA